MQLNEITGINWAQYFSAAHLPFSLAEAGGE
jgi:hypothetical protein